ncbi:MAG: hypothetical protein ACRDRZ_04010 [Pseudonocardiaceae bacterium]
MTSTPNRRIRTAALTGLAALALALTGACNDTAPVQPPGNQQDGGDEQEDDQQGDDDQQEDDNGGY